MVAVVIPAAGMGQRMKSSTNKVFLQLKGKPILVWTVEAFFRWKKTCEIVVVVGESQVLFTRKLLTDHGLSDIQVISGGPTRQESVYRGLQAVNPKNQYVMIHDGARPFVTEDLLWRSLDAVRDYDAVVPGLLVKDTIKEVSQHKVVKTLPRDSLWAMQTPQTFLYSLILKAHQQGTVGTDDASLVEQLGEEVQIIEGCYQNIKITTPHDLVVGEAWVSKQEEKTVHPRLGFGYDVHRLVRDRPLLLGGVTIPYVYGLEGHSDADVVVHALMDAILGAMALGDIGQHFPDTEKEYAGISSMELLARVLDLVSTQGRRIVHVDMTIAAQKPKLAPFIPTMRENIALGLGLPLFAVSIKATTTEGLGFVGKEEGIAAYAVATLT